MDAGIQRGRGAIFAPNAFPASHVRLQIPISEILTMPVFCSVDDKHVPLYRIIWISDLPHYCGGEDCQREGLYEIRLEQSETVWANQHDHDAAVEALEAWLIGSHGADEPE